MIDFSVIVCGLSETIKQAGFFPDKPRFSAFSELEQYQCHLAAFLMADQAKPLGFQPLFSGQCNELGHTLTR